MDLVLTEPIVKSHSAEIVTIPQAFDWNKVANSIN